MFRPARIAFSIGLLFLAFGAQSVRAGWSDIASSLTSSNSSPVISIKKHKSDDDDHGDNDDHHHGKNKKHNDDAGLSECTIQQPGGGGGCKTGFKRVCEKMKSGNKCCGCVADKSQGTSATGDKATSSSGGIKPVEEVPDATLLLPYFECDVNSPNGCSQLKEKK